MTATQTRNERLQAIRNQLPDQPDPDTTWLLDEVDRLGQELAWYADKRNWSYQEPDLGARARAALRGGGE